ncbi:U-scoloptoxin(05)-Sm1a-like [Ruditapes philippinarum]|uniref:U-scoloptoxin(05)-Sm1a-like n=1 Tax=Ruditapes philippinarum TaxID=129788 RepID=UPI00295AEF11|nr:U-scoloptoxin(05)-Sm1a-like [Ruditapes philippinarum]
MEIRIIVQYFSAILILSKTGEALNCYQCDSTLDHNCQEYFNHDNPNVPLRATECKMYNAKFCIKATGLWGGIVGTHRFCSSRDLGDQCQDMRFPDHSRKYRGCIYTCTGDGCNSAHGINFSFTVMALSLLSVVVAIVMRR